MNRIHNLRFVSESLGCLIEASCTKLMLEAQFQTKSRAIDLAMTLE